MIPKSGKPPNDLSTAYNSEAGRKDSTEKDETSYGNLKTIPSH